MQLKVNEVKLPAPITFNYEELKQELLLKAETYASLVYTEDQIQAAKKDRADLNRLKKALNDERMKREREYMQPFSEFKTQINEIISIIDKPCAVIDRQVKAFEEQKKAEKLKAIEEYWHSVLAADKVPEAVSFKLILDSRWLNASVSMKSIQDIIDGKLEQIAKDLAVIDSLPSYSFEARECYIDTLDLARAVSEAHRLQEQAEKKAAWEAEQQKRKEEAEKVAAASPATTFENEPATEVVKTVTSVEKQEPCRQWIGFQAFLSVDEAKALGAWFKENGIRYKSL
jgi:hypothetical protein